MFSMLNSPTVVYHFKGLDKNNNLVLHKCEAGVETDVVRIAPLTRNIPQPWGATIVRLIGKPEDVHLKIQDVLHSNHRSLGPVLRNTAAGGWLLHDNH